MTQPTKDNIIRKLKALTDGPSPLLHHAAPLGPDMVAISVQPWGTPLFLNWAQAEMFANDLPLQMPAYRKSAGSEQGRHRKRKTA